MNDQYSELYPTYQWFVPSQFNIAQACVHRWAENPVEGRRIAVFHENEFGQREVWTYSRLSEAAKQLANGLIKMGVLPGDRVALAMGQRPEAVASYMAIFSVGAVALPLSSQLGADGLAIRLRDADARVAIVDAIAGPDLLQAQAQCPLLSQIIALEFQHEAIIPWRTLLARQTAIFKAVATKSNSPALLLYTSGTNGAPKGALLAHSALIGNLPGFVASQNWFPQKSDVFWTPADWTWTGGLMDALLPTLYFGRSIVGALGGFSPPRTGTPGTLPGNECLSIPRRAQACHAGNTGAARSLSTGAAGHYDDGRKPESARLRMVQNGAGRFAQRNVRANRNELPDRQ